MNRKALAPTLLWGLVPLLLLALAFLCPRLLLAQEQTDSLEASYRLDASAYLLETAPGDYLKKLQALSGRYSERIPLRIEGIDLAPVRNRAQEELEKLEQAGLLPRGFTQEMEATEQNMAVGRFCAINRELGTLFEIFQIEVNSRPISLTVDRATGKVLQLFFTDLEYAYTEALTGPEMGGPAKGLGQAWATYLGLPLVDEQGRSLAELRNVMAEETDFGRVERLYTLRLGTEEESVELCLELELEGGPPIYVWRVE